MTNQEVFEKYSTEQFVIEQELYFLMQQYWDECHEKYKDTHLKINQPPINLIGFIKKFMKEETLVDIELAEQSKMNFLNKNIIEDADFVEIP